MKNPIAPEANVAELSHEEMFDVLRKFVAIGARAHSQDILARSNIPVPQDKADELTQFVSDCAVLDFDRHLKEIERNFVNLNREDWQAEHAKVIAADVEGLRGLLSPNMSADKILDAAIDIITST